MADPECRDLTTQKDMRKRRPLDIAKDEKTRLNDEKKKAFGQDDVIALLEKHASSAAA